MQTLTNRPLTANTASMTPTTSEPAADPYLDASDRLRHLDEMQRLAQETDYPMHVIVPIYEGTLTRLKADATIHDYLPILVAKGVRNVLKGMARHH